MYINYNIVIVSVFCSLTWESRDPLSAKGSLQKSIPGRILLLITVHSISIFSYIHNSGSPFFESFCELHFLFWEADLQQLYGRIKLYLYSYIYYGLHQSLTTTMTTLIQWLHVCTTTFVHILMYYEQAESLLLSDTYKSTVYRDYTQSYFVRIVASRVAVHSLIRRSCSTVIHWLLIFIWYSSSWIKKEWMFMCKREYWEASSWKVFSATLTSPFVGYRTQNHQ